MTPTIELHFRTIIELIIDINSFWNDFSEYCVDNQLLM
jgi:hypothetical protein